MQVHIKNKHKSIPKDINFELPKFCLLTGVNGSGKSHLLEAMSSNNTSTIRIGNSVATNITYVGYNALIPQVIEQSDRSSVINGITNFWAQISAVISHYKQVIANGGSYTDETVVSQFLRHHSPNPALAPAIAQILRKSGKQLDELTQEDASEDLLFAYASQDQLFFSNMALIFKAYHTKFYNNDVAEFRAKKYGGSLPFLTHTEFINKFGPPPWELINDIFCTAGLTYQVSSPESVDVDLPYTLRLIDSSQGVEISVNDLSSGEKVLMSLALALYNTSFGGIKPDLLLLDEPDAPLHPRFSKLLIEVLQETIVNKAGVHVVMTTHSPSTVAMAPDGSVFEVPKTSRIPQLISNIRAVEKLTEGISYLRVSYNPKKQIFVESKYDILYFQKLYNLLSRKYIFDHEPVFLEPHSGSSNCTDVISLVTRLRESGNDLAFGIVDYDLKNRSTDAIKVLGEGSRYAIENYLLDPLYIALTLIRYRKKRFEDFNITGKVSYMDAQNLSQNEAQILVDSVLNKIGVSLEDRAPTVLENGFVINYPAKFLFQQGHSYEKSALSAFPELNAVIKGQGDSALKLGVMEIIEELPQFLPRELGGTLTSLLGIKS